VNAHRERNIEPTGSEENYPVSQPDQLTQTGETFVIEASRDHGGGSGASFGCVIEESAGTKLPCVNPYFHKMKEKTLPKTVFIDPQVLALSDSWYLQKKDWAAADFDSKSLEVGTHRRLVNSQKMCQVSKPENLDSKKLNRKVNKSISGSSIKSMWL